MATTKRFFKKYLFLCLFVLVIVFAGLAIHFYRQSSAIDAQSRASLAEVKSLTKKVGELMVLPTDEMPTIATVSDPEALRDQSFFVDAKVGDKVLIYSKAKKAILYDPVQDKIITIAPLNGVDTKRTTQSTPIQPVTTPSTDKKGS